MKRLVLTVALLTMGLAAAALAGWQTSIEATYTGTTYTYWNTNTPTRMLHLDAVLLAHASAVADTVTLWRVDASTNLWQVQVATNANGGTLQYVYFTPDGNGAIAVPNTHGVRVTKGVTNAAQLIIDLTEPE